MAYYAYEGLIGTTPVSPTTGQIDSVQRHPLGLIQDVVDPVYGAGVAIYLKGVASTVVGSVVTWDAAGSTPSYQTALNAATANAGQQYAVATAAVLAGSFGWYLLAGTNIVATNGTLAGAGVVYAIAGGTVTSSATSGKAVWGMRALTATGTPAANQAICQFNYPLGQGVVA